MSNPKTFLFVLLGASNLARGHHAIAEYIRNAMGTRCIGFYFALGPGRGYRVAGGIMSHSYSPIETCGILESVERKTRGKIGLKVLVTDIGNDIMYGISGGELIDCLNGIFQRLENMGADICVSPISVWLEKELDPVKFYFLRTLFYPRSSETYRGTIDAISAVNLYIKNEAKTRVTVIEGLDTFFGLDRIHYDCLKSGLAWRLIAQSLLSGASGNKMRPIRISQIIKSYQTHYRQLIVNDYLSWGTRGSNYF